MKFQVTLLVIALAMNTYAQEDKGHVNIRLNGKVDGYDSKDTARYIYYTMEGQSFSKGGKFKYDKAGNYTFELYKTSLRRMTSGNMILTLDTTQSCSFSLNITGINAFANSKSMKTIHLHNDLVMDFSHCMMGPSMSLSPEEQKLLGTYTFRQNDTLYSFTLYKSVYIYESHYTPADRDVLNGRWGTWDYDKERNVLVLNTRYKLNREFGTMLIFKTSEEYKIETEGQRFQLVSKDGARPIRADTKK